MKYLKGLRMAKKKAKQTTFKLLDEMPSGTVFSSLQLTIKVNSMVGRSHFPDTFLRYIREYRDIPGKRKIENIDKARSIYKVA